MSVRHRRLNHSDRCDRCGAQAFVRVLLGADLDRWLDFCGHHYAAYEWALATVATGVYDERDWINAKPSQSANA